MSRRTTYDQALAAITAIRTSLHGSESKFKLILDGLNVLESYIGNPDKPEVNVASNEQLASDAIFALRRCTHLETKNDELIQWIQSNKEANRTLGLKIDELERENTALKQVAGDSIVGSEKSEFINVAKACEAAKPLVSDHWIYLEKTLVAHGTDPADIAIAKHHYISSGLHFYKHALEAVNAGEFDD